MADKEDERDEDEREDGEGEDEGEETSEASGSGQDESDDEEGDDEAEAPPSETSPKGEAEEEDEAEEGAEEGEDEDDAAPVAAAAPVPAAPAKKGDRLSAGARLAAAKAAKAAKKAAKKAAVAEERRAASAAPQPNEEEEETPEQAVERQLHDSAVGQAALKAQDWMKGNQTLVTGVAAAAALALLGWVGWNAYQGSTSEAAAAALQEAVEISQARVVAEGEDDEGEGDERTFESVAARSEAALEAYRAVVSQHGGTDAAAWAQLGVARLLLDQGEAADAREAYEAAVAARGSDPVVALRAYEGIGFTYEAEENWEEARDAFDRIRGIRDGAYGPLADYHLARLSIVQGDDVAAQEALEALVDAIRADSESSEPEFPYVLAQAQTLLRQLDPSSSDGSDSLDIEEMIRRMMAERAAGGGGE